jgi:hypothetical protein
MKIGHRDQHEPRLHLRCSMLAQEARRFPDADLSGLINHRRFGQQKVAVPMALIVLFIQATPATLGWLDPPYMFCGRDCPSGFSGPITRPITPADCISGIAQQFQNAEQRTWRQIAHSGGHPPSTAKCVNNAPWPIAPKLFTTIIAYMPPSSEQCADNETMRVWIGLAS